MLEYDPESHSKASHREWLSEKAVFKEVVPIADPTIRCAACHTEYVQQGSRRAHPASRMFKDAELSALWCGGPTSNARRAAA